MTLTKWATITNVPEAPNPTRSENLDTSVAETASKGCHWYSAVAEQGWNMAHTRHPEEPSG